MNIIKKVITMIAIMLLSIMILCSSVNAGTVNIKASKSKVTVGQNVSITVSFGEKVSAAQFKLDYDTSKFDYVSCSTGTFGTGKKTFVYVNYEDVADLGSVTITFKAKAAGTGAFNISGVVLSGSSSISKGKVTVTVENAKKTSTTNKTNKKTTNKKDTSKDNNEEDNQEPEEINKTTLNTIKQELTGKNQSDYTEESWNALQEAIAAAENATTNDEYNALIEKLTLDSLVKVEFEKTELNQVLRDLIGKSQEDYTQESWNELQEAINIADSAELKSEYDAVKDKLTINGLVLEERDFFSDLVKNRCGHGQLIMTLALIIIVLVIMIIVLLALYNGAKNKEIVGRRIK